MILKSLQDSSPCPLVRPTKLTIRVFTTLQSDLWGIWSEWWGDMTYLPTYTGQHSQFLQCLIYRIAHWSSEQLLSSTLWTVVQFLPRNLRLFCEDTIPVKRPLYKIEVIPRTASNSYEALHIIIADIPLSFLGMTRINIQYVSIILRNVHWTQNRMQVEKNWSFSISDWFWGVSKLSQTHGAT